MQPYTSHTAFSFAVDHSAKSDDMSRPLLTFCSHDSYQGIVRRRALLRIRADDAFDGSRSSRSCSCSSCPVTRDSSCISLGLVMLQTFDQGWPTQHEALHELGSLTNGQRDTSIYMLMLFAL
jgi:hypothetical protein